jgi:hypothetical protein
VANKQNPKKQAVAPITIYKYNLNPRLSINLYIGKLFAKVPRSRIINREPISTKEKKEGREQR